MTESKNIQYLSEHGKTINLCTIRRSELESAKEKPQYFALPYDITEPILQSIHLVQRFSSDVLCNINTLKNEILDGEEHNILVFGLRDSGVDGNSYFDGRISEWMRWNNHAALSNYYRKIFVVEYQIMKETSMVDGHYYEKGDYMVIVKDATHAIPSKDLNAETET